MYIIPMPINKDGEGPEMDENKVVKILYEVWDYDFITLAQFETEEEAEEYVSSHGF